LAEANAYFANHVLASTWESTTEDQRSRALIRAARDINDEIEWKGVRASLGQALEFPRLDFVDRNGLLFGTDAIPQVIKDMQSEQALYVLEIVTSAAPGMQGFFSVSMSGLNVTANKADQPKKLSPEVMSMAKFYAVHVTGSGMARLVRT
jgi:hypothetical protein